MDSSAAGQKPNSVESREQDHVDESNALEKQRIADVGNKVEQQQSQKIAGQKAGASQGGCEQDNGQYNAGRGPANPQTANGRSRFLG